MKARRKLCAMGVGGAEFTPIRADFTPRRYAGAVGEILYARVRAQLRDLRRCHGSYSTPRVGEMHPWALIAASGGRLT